MRDKEEEKRIRAYMEAKMKHIKIYNECMNLADGLDVAKFAELVRADEREKVSQWMIERSFATGHGDSIEDLLKEIEWQVKEREREACAKLVEADGLARGKGKRNRKWPMMPQPGLVFIKAAARIRARGE